MAAACTIRVECLDDGRYRAACTLFPGCEAVADDEEAARDAVQELIGSYLAEQLGPGSPVSPSGDQRL
jgi:predicted RNase H-like HicB family nuclease